MFVCVNGHVWVEAVDGGLDREIERERVGQIVLLYCMHIFCALIDINEPGWGSR